VYVCTDACKVIDATSEQWKHEEQAQQLLVKFLSVIRYKLIQRQSKLVSATHAHFFTTIPVIRARIHYARNPS